jgi:hypothetical protein
MATSLYLRCTVQHITTTDKSFLVGDDATDLLMRYAALTARISGGDAVKVNAISGDGDEVVATLLINSGTVMSAESVHTTQPEPENTELEQYLSERIAGYTDMPEGYPDSHPAAAAR